ncbi:MAG TPA: hypothetical protein PKA82_06920 [Pyrinomonadaceae bacterium]|nr:hypothetical protein [Pyrinomonadaceae bacterium]
MLGQFRTILAVGCLGSVLFNVGCSAAESKAVANAAANSGVNSAAKPAEPSGATIPIDKGGPADTVRAFYAKLRERKYREAIFLTNLKPAIESLTDAELAEFSVDFAEIAGQIPTEIKINGEIITGDKATVTAMLPSETTGKEEVQTIELRREGNAWIIQTVDAAAEARIKKEGKDYFFNLRIETHEEEAKFMLERVAKAQVARTMENGGICGEMQELIDAGLLPEDIKTSESTGYNYVIKLTPDKKRYFATATPAIYGKSGKRSYLLEPDKTGLPRVSNTDNGGKPMKH